MQAGLLGEGMLRSAGRSKRASRRLIAVAVVCGFVLQGMVLAVSSGLLAGAATNIDWATIELCHHSGGSSEPASPPLAPLDDGHCILCFVANSFVPGNSAHVAQYRSVAIVVIAWPFPTWHLPGRTIDANVRPRGPPHLS